MTTETPAEALFRRLSPADKRVMLDYGEAFRAEQYAADQERMAQVAQAAIDKFVAEVADPRLAALQRRVADLEDALRAERAENLELRADLRAARADVAEETEVIRDGSGRITGTRKRRVKP